MGNVGLHTRCTAENAISQAEVVRDAASVLGDLIATSQAIHGGDLGKLPGRIEDIFVTCEEVVNYYHSSDPEQYCDECASIPGQ